MKKFMLIIFLLPIFSFCSCEEEIKYDNICEEITVSKQEDNIKITMNTKSVEEKKQSHIFEYTGADTEEAFYKMFREHDNTIFKSCKTLYLPQSASRAEMTDILTYIVNENRIQLNCKTESGLSFLEYYRKFFSENDNGF